MAWLFNIELHDGYDLAFGSTRKAEQHFGMRAKDLKAGRLALMKRLGQDLVEDLQDEAPKKTGLFAAGLSYRLSEAFTGDTLVQIESGGEHARVGTTSGLQPMYLAKLLTTGTRPHIIPRGGSAEQMAKGYPLSFYWENGPRGPGLYHYWSVQHRETQPNPFIQRAVDRWWPGAQAQWEQLGYDVARLRRSGIGA